MRCLSAWGTDQQLALALQLPEKLLKMSSPLPPDHPDAATVAALRAGDRAAFQAIVEELNPGLTRMARTYVPAALADEVVQETWMAVVRSIGTFEGRSALKTWIYRIMLNKVRTLAVRETKVVPLLRSAHKAPKTARR